MASIGTGYHVRCEICGKRIKGASYARCKKCREADTGKLREADLAIGTAVRFHPIIGGNHDGLTYVVRAMGTLGRRTVVWLDGKPGCVAIEALSKPLPGFGFIDPCAP